MKSVKTAVRLLSLALCAVLAASVFSAAAVFAADGEAFSDIALAYGADGVQTLEGDGYTVMGRPLTGDVWLGYKKGGDAVTGLFVSSAGTETVTAEGIVFQRVGSIGDAGSLYMTRDAAAGDAVISLSLQSDEGLVDQPLYALKNDGTSPLRREDGSPCDLGDGHTAYLFILRENVFRPYVDGVKAVSGGDLRAAITAAAKAGCDFYYDPGLRTTDGQTVVLGYSRTKNEADAITCVVAGTDAPAVDGAAFESAGDVLIAGDAAYRMFSSRDRSAGNPVIGLTGSAVPVRASDVMNKWAEKTFVKFNTSAASVSQVKNEDLYLDFLKDDSPLTNVPVRLLKADGDPVTPLAYVCGAEGLPQTVFEEQGTSAVETEAETVLDTETASDTETEIAAESETAPETADDFDPKGYLEDEAEKIANDDVPDNVTASVFGAGTVGVIAALVLAAGAAAVIVAVAVRRGKRKAEEKKDDEN